MLVDKIIIRAEESAYFKELFDKLEKLNYYSFSKASVLVVKSQTSLGP